MRQWEKMTDDERVRYVREGGELTEAQFFEAIEDGPEELKRALQERVAERMQAAFRAFSAVQLDFSGLLAGVESRLAAAAEALKVASAMPFGAIEAQALEAMKQYARDVESRLAVASVLFDHRPTIKAPDLSM